MNTVTAIKAQKGQKRRVNVYLDGGFAFSLSLPIASKTRLHLGQTLSSPDIDNLKSADLFQRATDRAIRFLSPRPRSDAEIKARLRRDGFNADTVEQVLGKLKEQGLVNDAAFAQFWRENRESFRPRSRRLLQLELKHKGIDAETAAETISAVDDELNAYRAAQKKAHALSGLDYPGFHKRLGAFLKRRGFSFELVDHTVNQVWQERVGHKPDL